MTNPEGEWLVFYAYPKEFTFICPAEIIEFEKKAKDFKDRDAVVIGGSTDNEFSKVAWRTQHDELRKTKTPLAFITPAPASELGILDKEEGAALRVTYIVDPDGIIRYVSATDLSAGRNVDEVVRVLDALQSDGLCPATGVPARRRSERHEHVADRSDPGADPGTGGRHPTESPDCDAACLALTPRSGRSRDAARTGDGYLVRTPRAEPRGSERDHPLVAVNSSSLSSRSDRRGPSPISPS